MANVKEFSIIYNEFYTDKNQSYIIKAAAIQLPESRRGSEFDLLSTHKYINLRESYHLI